MKTIIIVPCYNEEQRLKADEFVGYIKTHPGIRFLFVNDGSRDGTALVLEAIRHRAGRRCEVLTLHTNRGKAEAVRAGFHFATRAHKDGAIGYFDADMATPLGEIERLIEILEGGCELAMGSRIRRMGADIRRHQERHLIGRAFATAVSNILQLPVYDTQCGAKVMTRTLALAAIDEPFMCPWLFDVELIARAVLALGYRRSLQKIYEVPLSRWEDKAQSKVKLMDFVRTPTQLWKIYRRYYFDIKRLKKVDSGPSRS